MDSEIFLFESQCLSTSDAYLLLYQIKTCNPFCDRVLNLQASVHLQKIVVELVVHQKFNCPCPQIPARLRYLYCITAHGSPDFRRQHSRRSLFNYLLVASLNTTLSLK